MNFKSWFKIVGLVLLVFVLASWGRTGHRVVSLKSALSYNQEMKNFWDWTAYLTTHSSDADARRVTLPNEAPYHYIDIDNFPEFKTTGKISQSYDEMISTHGEKFLLKQGILPWTTLSVLDSLIQSFSKKDFEKAAYFAADLGHFVADGHMPFHITGNYDGQLTGNKGIHGRYESAMINRFENEFEYSGKPAVYITNPEDYIFGYLYKNYNYIDSVLIADKLAQKVAGNSSSKLYTETLWNETGGFTQNLFEEASFAFSSLLYTAWVNGGKPNIKKDQNFFLTTSETLVWKVSTHGFFNKAIEVDYLENTDKKMSISVYDFSGELVEVLFEAEQNSAPVQIEWKPKNKGKAVYFVVLKSEHSYYVRKVQV